MRSPLVLVVFLLVSGWMVVPPSVVPASAPADHFSAERAMAHVRAIATEPHPMGSAAIARVRDTIVAELKKLGIDVELQALTVPNYYGGGEPVRIVNVLGRIPGTATTKAVLLMGHYDTVPTTAGANDNTAAVATLLETGRALRAGPSLRNDVVLLFTDAEEPAPRYGATAFVSESEGLESIGLVVNFEASGGSGPSVLSETNGPEPWLIRELAAADARPAAYSVLTATTRLMGKLGTDFDEFKKAGVTGLHFAYLHDSPIYHTEADDIASVSGRSLQHHGDHALGIARHFGSLDLRVQEPSGGLVYFTVGPVCIRYAASWALPWALLALLVGAVGGWRRRGSTGTSALASLLGFLRTLGAGLLAVIVGTLLWLLALAIRPTPGVLESTVYFACILALAAWIAARVSRGRKRPERLDILWIWIGLALLTAIGLPGYSYLFTWPALAAAAAILWKESRSRALQTLLFAIVAATTLLLLVPSVDIFFQMAQPRPGNPDSEMKAAAALPLLLTLLSWGLLRAARPRRAGLL